MKFSSQKVTLKNGKTVLLRMCDESDAQNLINTIKTYVANSEYIPLHVHEFTPTLEEEIEWISKFIYQDNSLLIIAVYEGQIIGNIDLSGRQREIMQHTGEIGMGMLKEWRNTGLGTALLIALIDWAKENPILEKLCLGVYSENKAGLALYTKLCFTVDGRRNTFL
jgi:RimJ/RimL family protein N-acetyltransferase